MRSLMEMHSNENSSSHRDRQMACSVFYAAFAQLCSDSSKVRHPSFVCFKHGAKAFIREISAAGSSDRQALHSVFWLW